MGPGGIYLWFTQLGILKLLEGLHSKSGVFSVPGISDYYVVQQGDMGSEIYLRQVGKEGPGLLMYFLAPKFGKKDVVFHYIAPTWAERQISPLMSSIIYTPMEAFIRRFILWQGGDMGIFEDILIKIRTGNLEQAEADYVAMSEATPEEAKAVVEKLYKIFTKDEKDDTGA